MASLEEAQIAVLDAVVAMAKDSQNYSGTTGAAMLQAAGNAYRAVKGGAQPGTSVIDK